MLKDYIDLGYKPTKQDLVCEYNIEPAQVVGFEDTYTHMAGESSIDTWTDISTSSPQLVEEIKPHVIFIDEKQQTVRVAYTLSLEEYAKTHSELKAALEKWG